MLLFISLAHAGAFVEHFTSTVAPANGIVFDSVVVYVHELKLRACTTNQITTVAVDTSYDFVVGEAPTVPSGTWCGITLTLTGGVDVAGHVANGATFGANLALDRVPFPASGNGITVGSAYTSVGTFRAASTDWITSTLLNLAAGTHREYVSGDTVYATMMDAVAETSALTSP